MIDLRHDTRVAQLREKLGFTGEALCIVVSTSVSMQQLERHYAALIAILGTVDRSHATAPGEALNLKAIGNDATGIEPQSPHAEKVTRESRACKSGLA
jgi:hypothetical protein